MSDSVQLLCAGSGKNHEAIWEGRKFLKFLLPHSKDRERGDNQHPANPASICERAGDGNGGKRFSCAFSAHFH